MMNIASRKSTVTAVASSATTFLSTSCNRSFKKCEFYSKSSQSIPRPLPSFSSVVSPKTSALSHTHNTNNIIEMKRNLISTSSHYEPPIPLQDGFVERPGIIISLRSHCQSTSDVDRKDEYLGNEFSRRGVSYKGIQLPCTSSSSSSSSKIQYNDLMSNGCYEINNDIQSLEQPNVILLAHGPIPSLVAQYYLESFSLAGLVMIDPFLVPFSKESLESSGRELLQRMNENDGEWIWNDDRTTLESIMSSITTHSEIEDSLRTLKLESGSVPMLVLSTQQHSSLVLHTNLKKNLDEIAQYHSHEHYTFSPVKVITLEGKDNDLYQSMVKEVYTWIDDDFVL